MLNKKLINQAATVLQSKNTNKQGKKPEVNSQVVALVGTARVIQKAMAQGGIGGAARVVRGPRAKKPAPAVPDEHVPVPMVPAEHRTLLVQGLTPQISDELLELYFENTKCGGGEIESVHREDEDRARVVFKDDLVVEDILEHGNHRLRDVDLFVTRVPVEEHNNEEEGDEEEANSGDEANLETPGEVTASAILVGGLHPSTDKEVLELFFENTKRTGGGRIKDIQMYQDLGRAIIWFAETTTVENVLQRGPLSLAGSELTIAPYIEQPMVKISGVTQNISEETLELYFENTKRSGGGEIKSIDMFPSMQAAIITFEDTAVADRVVDKHNFTLSKCELVAERFFGLKPNDKQSGPPPKESPGRNVNEQRKKKRGKGGIKSERRPVEEKITDDEEASPESSSDEHELESCSIEVSGMNKETSQETLKMFFENRRKSGGGQIENVWFNKSNGNYVITFKNREAVNRVEKRQHKLEGAQLKITVMEAVCQRGPQLEGGLELNKVYVTGLNEKISRDQLELHMEGSVNCEVVDVVYGLDPSVAMVTCKNNIKYRALRRAFSRKHIQGCMLGLYQVPRPTCVQVSNIGDISEDSLSAYFENKRSGGSGDVDVVIHREQGCAIVTFDSFEILQNVRSRPKHRHEGRDLQLCVHRERLGIIPTTHDTSQPCVQIPNDVIVKDMDRNKVHFLKTVQAARKHAEVAVMKKLHAKIDWDHKSDTELHVMCTLRNDDKDVRNLARDWNETVKESLQYLFNTIKVERRECLKKTWKDVCFEVQKIRKGSPGVAVIDRDDESSLYVVGKAETVKKIYQQVDKMCDEIEQKLEHMKDTIDLQDFERAVFLKTNQKQKLDKRYPKVRITLRQSDIEVEGPPKDLLSLQKELNSFQRNVHQRKLSLSKGQLKVLTMLQRQQHNKFNNSLQKLEVVMQVDGDNLMLLGGEKDIDECIDLLKKNIRETTIEVSKEEQTALKESIWKDLPNILFLRYNGIIHLELESNSSVNLVTQVNDFDGALEEVMNHIRKNAMREVYVELEMAETRMIMQWMVGEIKTIEEDFERYHVRITAQDDYGFVITGTEDGIVPAKTRTEKLTEKIITDRHTVTTPGMPYYFTQDVGKYFLKSQEDRYQVIIHHEDPNQERQSNRRRPTPQPRSSTMELQQTTHSSGVKIKVIVGDMTLHKVDAIVNAANANLAHVGGLAKAIVDKGGRTIQTESDEHVRQYGPVMEGHAVLTGAGKLPCKKIIHAVGPHWNGGRIGEEDILHDCVFSHILMIAFQENFFSVAIPAISAGVFGFPLVKSTAIIVEAVKDFLDQMNQRGNLSEIHLLDNRQEGGQAFVTALKKRFKITQPAAPPIPARRLPNNAGVGAQRVTPQRNQNTFRTNEGLVVTLKIGTIASEQVDIIFNTTAKDLNLHSGAISQSIVNAAGNGIQREVSQKCRNGLQAGQHVTSSGGNLSCSEIFHAVLCNWDNGQGSAQQLLKSIVVASLNYGTQRGYQSIALPAMGTGNLQFPRDVVANTMFDTAIEFSRANPNTTMKDVRFVLFNKDQPTIDAFEDYLSTLTGTKNAGSSAVGNVSNRRVYKGGSAATEDPQVGAVGGIPEPLEPMAGNAFIEPIPARAAGGGGGEIKIGSIRLQVVPGDITKERTDAIVNGTNPELDLSQGAVSKAIASAAGAQLQLDCQKIGGIKQNGVAITSGGNLAAKHVLHLDVQGLTDKGEWKKGITRCLQQAERNELSSISFPALGTGMLNIPASKMALAMMEAIAEFSKKNTNISISLVRVVIFQEDMVATYLEQMEKAMKPGSSILGMVTAPFRYIGDTIKGFFSKSDFMGKRTHGGVPVKVEKIAATLDFTILGLKKENIEAVKREIQNCCLKESADILISGPEYSEIIMVLDQFKIEQLENVGNKIGVKMTVDRGHRIARIRLQGQSKDVFKAESRIKEMLHKIRAELMEQQEAVMLAQFVQWECKEPNNKFQPYPAEINTKLEKAQQKGDQIVEWIEEEATGNIIQWKIDLKSMKETDGKNTKDVQRRVIAEKGPTMDLPKTWSKMTGPGVYELVNLSTTSPEYQTVSQEFQKTCGRQIMQIERLQNKYLYRRYAVHKEALDARNQGINNEMQLWHGTASNSITSINTNGFNRSYCGQNGTAYGQGVYFAVNAQYSAGYTSPDQNGHSKMYYARVLTGQPVQGHPSMKTPPSRNDPQNPSLHFDSNVDRLGNPNMYIIYYDTQAYPEYIVSFR